MIIRATKMESTTWVILFNLNHGVTEGVKIDLLHCITPFLVQKYGKKHSKKQTLINQQF